MTLPADAQRPSADSCAAKPRVEPGSPARLRPARALRSRRGPARATIEVVPVLGPATPPAPAQAPLGGGGRRLRAEGPTPQAGRQAGRLDLSQIRGAVFRRGGPIRAPPSDVPPPRPRDRVRVSSVRRVPYVAGTPEEEFLARRGQRQSGATRTAPAHPAARPPSRQRGHHPGARPRRARGRGRGRARPRRARRAARSSRSSRCWCARSGPGSRPTTDLHRGPARRAAQAPRRHRDDPGQDRRPRHLAARAARRGRRRLRRGQRRCRREMLRAGRGRAGPEEAEPAEPAAAAATPERRVVPQSVDRPPARQPLPRARLLRRRAAPRRHAPARQLGAARPAVPLVRVRRGGASSCMDLPEPTVAARRRAAWS